jgi:hypothetical protein
VGLKAVLADASVQRGQVVKRGKRWGARWYDETDVRRFQGGFETRSAARAFLDAKVEEVAALRRGDPSAVRRRQMPTVCELVDEYVGQHNAEANTIRTLKARLRYTTHGPGLDGQGGWKDLPIDRLTITEIGAWRRHLPERSAWAIHKTLLQVLHYAVRAKLLDENPAVLVPNPERSGGRFPRSRRSANSRGPATSSALGGAACRCSSGWSGCARRSGLRSNAATSTARPASYTFAASTRTAR